jgi:nickel/cobalt transporter (NicO) family protein
MTSVLIGSLLISLLHAIIPNHWLPILAIGRKEGWSLAETTRITFIAGMSHVISTVVIGALLAMIGSELATQLEDFTKIIGPSILVLIGLYFVRQHYTHHHFHLDKKHIEKKSKTAVILALVIAMFLSPCMEIEAYFLLAGTKGWYFMALIAGLYALITISGMLIWIRIAYKGILKLNWHKWEHNAGIITGFVLIITGIISFVIN